MKVHLIARGHQWQSSVTLTDFPGSGGGGGGGAPIPKVDVKSYYLANFFPKNCMKLKEFGPWGCVPGAPIRFVNVYGWVGAHYL